MPTVSSPCFQRLCQTLHSSLACHPQVVLKQDQLSCIITASVQGGFALEGEVARLRSEAWGVWSMEHAHGSSISTFLIMPCASVCNSTSEALVRRPLTTMIDAALEDARHPAVISKEDCIAGWASACRGDTAGQRIGLQTCCTTYWTGHVVMRFCSISACVLPVLRQFFQISQCMGTWQPGVSLDADRGGWFRQRGAKRVTRALMAIFLVNARLHVIAVPGSMLQGGLLTRRRSCPIHSCSDFAQPASSAGRG